MKIDTRIKNKFQSGQSIIEFIVGAAILVIIGTSATVALVGSYSANTLSQQESQASSFGQEAIAAVESIRNQNWGNLTNGTHGLSNASGSWIFAAGSSDTNGIYTRSVTVSDVYRNNGQIVSSGGSIDPNTKLAEVQVSWNSGPTRKNSIRLDQYFTNWQTAISKGTVSASCTNQASCLDLATSSATLVSNNKTIEGLTFTNNNPATAATIDKMTVTWTKPPSSQMNSISIGGTTVWTGGVLSGNTVDITNVTVPAGTSITIDSINFSKGVNTSTFDISFIMSDGSTYAAPSFSP